MDKELPHTLIYYESPFRIQKFLAAALEVLGERRAAVCVELTKQFEKTHRGMLSELVEQFTDKNVRGEITVVIAGNHPKFAADQGGGDGEDQPDSDEADEDPDSGADDEADMDQDSEDD
jgi:16S rRNA (cytidine1402-2'-O)-methyltransferase